MAKNDLLIWNSPEVCTFWLALWH